MPSSTKPGPAGPGTCCNPGARRYKQLHAWREDGTWTGSWLACAGPCADPSGRLGSTPEPSTRRPPGRTGTIRGYEGEDAGKQPAVSKCYIVVGPMACGWPWTVAAPPSCNAFAAVAATVSQTVPAVGLRVVVGSKPPGTKGFTVLPHCPAIERTFAWLGKYHRVAGDNYETNSRNSEAGIKACLSSFMLQMAR